MAPPPAEAFDRAAAVFAGEVVEIDDRLTVIRKALGAIRQFFGREPYPEGTYCSSMGFEVTLRVTRIWKGKPGKTLTVFTGRGGGDCGFPFERGKEYLIYLPSEPWERCDVDICSRSAKLADAAEDLQYLATRQTR